MLLGVVGLLRTDDGISAAPRAGVLELITFTIHRPMLNILKASDFKDGGIVSHQLHGLACAAVLVSESALLEAELLAHPDLSANG